MREAGEKRTLGGLPFLLAMAGLWAIGLACAFAGGWISELLLRRPEALAEGPRYWAGVGFVVIGSLTIGLTTWIIRKRIGRAQGWIATGIGLLLVGSCCLSATNIGARARCGAAGLKAATALRGVSEIGLNSMNKRGDLPASFVAELLRHGRADDLYGECLGVLASDVVIGRYSMRDLETGRVTKEELIREAIGVAQHGGEWEFFGVAAFSRDAARYDLTMPHCVLNFAVFPNAHFREYSISMGDGSVRSYDMPKDADAFEFAAILNLWASERHGERRIPPADELAEELLKMASE